MNRGISQNKKLSIRRTANPMFSYLYSQKLQTKNAFTGRSSYISASSNGTSDLSAGSFRKSVNLPKTPAKLSAYRKVKPLNYSNSYKLLHQSPK